MNLDLRNPTSPGVYGLLTNLVVPRPIAWVTSHDTHGRLNLAPFSFFNLVGSAPPIVVIGVGDDPGSGLPKHTAQNIAATKEFVVNLVTEELADAMNLTAADFPEGHNELEAAGLHPADSRTIRVPRVLEAKAALECTLHRIERIGYNNIILGQVTGIHIAEEILDPRMRIHDFHPLGRIGTPSWYTRTRDKFEMHRMSYAQVVSK